MKTKRFLVVMVVLTMMVSCLSGTLINAATDTASTVSEASAYIGAPVVFTLTNSASVNGTTVTGVTESKYYDETKAKEVRKFAFDTKAAGENKEGSPNVRASFDGFKQFMTDENVNTISFDYKITGTSTGSIGLFMGESVEDFGDQYNTGIMLNNTQGINLRAKVNRNTGGSDWYAFARSAAQQQATPNNREWNRLTLEVNKQNGDVKAYINGEYFTTCSNSTGAAKPPVNMDSLCFQTAAKVDATTDLAILFDNISVYPGERRQNETPVVEIPGLSLTNSTSVNGTTVTGVTESKYYDETKAKNVRRFDFNAKAACENATSANASKAINVRASLDGFRQFMTDSNVNTISFDYKITGTSTGSIGLFMGESVEDFGDQLNTGIMLNNTQGINLRAKVNRNSVSDWYTYARSAAQQQATPNNREWNRLTLEVNKQNGDVKAYINGEYFTTCSNSTGAAKPPVNMDSLCFQTAAKVDATTDLAILFDNVLVYPGNAMSEVNLVKITDVNGIDIEQFIVGDTVYLNAGVENKTDESKDYIAILGVYNSANVCIDAVLYELKDVQSGQRGYIDGTTLGLTLPNDAATVKAFFWNSWNSIAPVYNFDTAVLKTVE